ncbi:hypothetical protein GCM10025862_41310 [Arsenicicoccus piscis]|uniref:DNA polymerase III subunit delta n=1 Tax=Arsenicicoccus piscis TaxID=673954 RepID=A0ABQ6HUA0_9MICO|nr:hypothetical protein GCM10025862_41310 [Arsenicicoccus piscis]
MPSHRPAWEQVIGQPQAVATLSAAASEPDAMTHAWLLTGPPGSGRSVAARAFAAALQCPEHGCGHCRECRTALDGSHADVEVVATSGLSLTVERPASWSRSGRCARASGGGGSSSSRTPTA